TGNPIYHECSIKLLNSFVYARGMIWVFETIDLFTSYADTYSLAIFLAGVLAAEDGPIPWFSRMYIVGTCLVVMINQWTTGVVGGGKGSSSFERALANVLLALGFANLETVQRLRLQKGDTTKGDDKYTSNAHAAH
ncbi:hypothetical protein FRB99_006444, partial [Tulasnella sp. 403]